MSPARGPQHVPRSFGHPAPRPLVEIHACPPTYRTTDTWYQLPHLTGSCQGWCMQLYCHRDPYQSESLGLWTESTPGTKARQVLWSVFGFGGSWRTVSKAWTTNPSVISSLWNKICAPMALFQSLRGQGNSEIGLQVNTVHKFRELSQHEPGWDYVCLAHCPPGIGRQWNRL